MPATSWLLVGAAHSRRIEALQQALRRHGLPAAPVVDYLSCLTEPQRLADAIGQHPQAMIKLESPGEDPKLHAALIQSGWHCLGQPGPPPQALLHGELAYQHYWYAGFVHLLQALPGQAHYFNPPADLAGMSDKLACQQRLQAAGVAVPDLYGPIQGYQDMRMHLRQHQVTQVFIKARYGSSGAGVLAYRWHHDGREWLAGSAELSEQAGQVRVFNSLRPRHYTDTFRIARLIDTLAMQGSYLERWIPKPRLPGQSDHHYDLRVVTLAGQARQRVARASRGPLTNLHLGNRRVPLENCLDPSAITCLEKTLAHAAASFPHSRMIGFDVITRGQRSWVIEANGFGDLLPDLRWQGRTTYDDQALLFATPTTHRTLAHV